MVVSKPLYKDIIAYAKNNDLEATEIVLNSIEFNEAEFDDLDRTTLYDIVDNVLLLCKMNLATLRPSNFEEIISALHEDHGHFGFTGVRHRLLACGYNWSNMTEDIKKVIHNCSACQQWSRGLGPIFTKLKPTSTDQPFQHVAIDIMCAFTPTRSGNTFALVMVDAFSDFVFLRPMKSKETNEIAAIILLICADFWISFPITVR